MVLSCWHPSWENSEGGCDQNIQEIFPCRSLTNRGGFATSIFHVRWKKWLGTFKPGTQVICQKMTPWAYRSNLLNVPITSRKKKKHQPWKPPRLPSKIQPGQPPQKKYNYPQKTPPFSQPRRLDPSLKDHRCTHGSHEIEILVPRVGYPKRP